MLTFSSLSLRRGTRLLLSDVTFTIHRGEKVGILGANGCGKSSLLALMLGELQPDAGAFDMPSQLVIAHVAQELDATEREAIDFVMDGDAELRATEAAMTTAEAGDAGAVLGELHARYAALGGYDARSRAARLMHGLGFAPADETRPVSAFSGGWRVRLNLARALMCRSDLLLLDEPTNHLDLDAVLWLEEWLRDYPGTLLMIAGLHRRDRRGPRPAGPRQAGAARLHQRRAADRRRLLRLARGCPVRRGCGDGRCGPHSTAAPQAVKPGGRMVLPIGTRFTTHQLVLVRKLDDGRITTRQMLPVAFVPLTCGHD